MLSRIGLAATACLPLGCGQQLEASALARWANTSSFQRQSQVWSLHLHPLTALRSFPLRTSRYLSNSPSPPPTSASSTAAQQTYQQRARPKTDAEKSADQFLLRLSLKMGAIKDKLSAWGITGEISKGTKFFLAVLIGLLVGDWFIRIREPKSHGLLAELFCRYYNKIGLSDADQFFADKPDAQRQANEEEGYLLRQEQTLGLPSLPYRTGPAPKTSQGACQFQLDQLPSKDFALLVRYEVLGPSSTLLRKPGVSTNQSSWEKPPTTALFFAPPSIVDQNNAAIAAQIGVKPKEFAFLQELKTFAVEDIASWHLILHPADAKLAVSRGWCCFHPLAGRFSSEAGFVMFYAPRDATEVAVLARFLSAALDHAQQMFRLQQNASNLPKHEEHTQTETETPTQTPTPTTEVAVERNTVGEQEEGLLKPEEIKSTTQ